MVPRSPSVEVCMCGAITCSVPISLATDRGWLACAQCGTASFGPRSVDFGHIIATASKYGLRVLLEELRAHEAGRPGIVTP